MQITVELANKRDKKEILRFYKSVHYSARFLGGDICYLIRLEQKIIASVMLSSILPDSPTFLLHALVVDKKERSVGYAKALLNSVKSQHSDVVCFADKSLRNFYEKHDYVALDCEHLPVHLAKRYQAYLRNKPDLIIFVLNK